MIRIPSMKTSISARRTVALLLIATALSPLAYAEGNEAIMQTAGNVPYVSGGIGIDAINRLDAMAGQFNLKLVFASQSGEYLSDVKVTITDTARKIVLDTMSEGPWLMTKLRPGQYQIVATYGGNVEKRTIAVGAAKLNTVDFRWRAD